MSKQNTLTRKLFFRISPTILITIVLIGTFAFFSASREINNIYDAQLINSANTLWYLLQDEFEEAGADTAKKIEDIDFSVDNQLAINEDADDYADAHMFRAWKKDKIIMYSNHAFPQELSRQQGGFTNIIYKNEAWRIYNLPLPNTSIAIEVGEKFALRETLVDNILLDLIYPLIVLIFIVGVLVWVGIKSGLAPLRRLVQEIRSRSPSDLAPVAMDALPGDLLPLGNSLNQLLNKLKKSFNSERRFSDHAAHQLRTPLASLKLLLQMLEKADHDEERKALQVDLMNSIEKATHLVEQLLRAARVSHQAVSLSPVRLYKTVASAIAEIGVLAMQKHQNLSLVGDENAIVMADEMLLYLLAINIIENAVKYTPDFGTIDVRIVARADQWVFSVIDNGCGIPVHHREFVFNRFYRVDTPSVEGTGLGLSIVAGILDRLEGSILLKDPDSGKGLCVEIVLPKA